MPETMPALALEIASVVGQAGLAAIVDRWGGDRLTVHAQPRPDSELADLLGDAYADFQERFQGETLDVPLCGRHAERLLEEAVLRDRAAGVTVSEIVSRYKISRRRVFRIQARARRRNGEG